jgi:chemotaxis protein MotB
MKPDVSDDIVINPYIAYTDVFINMLLIILLFLTATLSVGRAGNADVRYKRHMSKLEEEVNNRMPPHLQPVLLNYHVRNDPLGTHRWVFAPRSAQLFSPGSANLTAEGRLMIQTFAKILQGNKDKWRRIRVEGHTRLTNQGELADWLLSTQRAIAVANLLALTSNIKPHEIAVAGRGSQAPLSIGNARDIRNDRVEIVIEFGSRDARGYELKP